MEIDLGELDKPRERWLDLGGVRFLIRYQTPLDSDRFRRECIRSGIMKTERGGEIGVQEGREQDYARAFCQRYVLGWAGNIKPDGAAYSSEEMARLMVNRRPVYEALHKAIGEDEAFFGNGVSGPTPS